MTSRLVVPAHECGHVMPAQVSMPSRESGREANVVPFGWCRDCGAIWLPKLPSFDRGFERHDKIPSTSAVDGIGAVAGYWILPGAAAPRIVISDA